jgi:metal-responsive CopG/Arc/MetJ family transcriptional regulator
MKNKKDIREVVAFRFDPDLVEALDRLFDRDGISPSEAVRRALRPWLVNKGVLRLKPPQTRVSAARKRSAR